MGNRMSNIATPMPQIRARFTSKLGIPLSGCKVYTYEPNSNIPKTTWVDIDKTVENTNPILLDAAGEADIFLDGLYQIVVKDRFGFVVYDVEKTGIKDDITLLKNGDYAPVLGSPVRLKLNSAMASFLYGISDPTHLDDNLNNFRGLNNPHAWDDSNIAIGGVAFGRNNVPFAYLSTALGHDCVGYGVASLVGGAGSCTGNPDVPGDGATYGYCSFAWGKDTQARGRISNAMGEQCLSDGRYTSTDGYQCIAGPALTSHPNGVASEGAAARAHGYDSQAYGNFAFAYGALLRAYNGAQVIGKGNYSTGTPLTLSKKGLGLGYNVAKPTIFCAEGEGIDAGGANVGFNTDSPTSRYDFRMGKSDTVTHVIESSDASAAVAFEVKGLLGNGSLGSLHNLVITHPNADQAYSAVTYYLNGNPYLQVDQNRKAYFYGAVDSGVGFRVGGIRVLGPQLAAIANSTGTAADNQRAINAILTVIRSHGLIAT